MSLGKCENDQNIGDRWLFTEHLCILFEFCPVVGPLSRWLFERVIIWKHYHETTRLDFYWDEVVPFKGVILLQATQDSAI